jgi:hypothetical protein
MLYEPVRGINGKPLEFNYSDAEFAGYLPFVRMAFKLIGIQQQDMRKFVHDLAETPCRK